jgi:ATP-binding cassette subfamily F protein 3
LCYGCADPESTNYPLHMLSVNNLDIHYGDKHLFKKVTVRLNGQERVGLVGVNGAGKSTLLKIMAGLIEADAGVVTRAKRTTVGYLPQEITSFPSGRTLYQEAETAFADLLAVQKELDALNQRLTSVSPKSTDYHLLLMRQGELQHQLEQSDIFRMEAQIEKVLTGLGFRPSDLGKDCQAFSGGWLMRLMLAKLLLARPSLLLLDEPTNHLDIESVTWLEEFLGGYPGAMVIISHDRSFLDNLTDTTWELSLGILTVYKGNYTKYVAEKETRLEVLRAAYDNQQAKIQQTMRFVERFRAKSTKASQVQSRLRQLEKMEKIELETGEHQISFRFPPAAPSGRLALEVSGLAKNYDGRPVFRGIDFQLQRGDKLAVVGVNGAGKSTLVRILAGEESSDQGTITYGHNVQVSYFGQHQARELDPQLSVLETLTQVTEDLTTTQIRSLLGAFLFRGEEVDKKVQVLSGGEKSRLALAKMIATPANLLIMDEPTNHLDMISQEVLQKALARYDGTIIIVSHNRYFLDRFVGNVLEIKSGTAALYEGNISDYLERVKRLREEANGLSAPPEKTHPAPVAKVKSKEARRLQAQQRQEKNRKLAPFKKQSGRAEEQIEELENRKGELEKCLADPELYRDQDAFAERSKEYKEVERRLERIYHQWEEAQAKIEEIEASFEG